MNVLSSLTSIDISILDIQIQVRESFEGAMQKNVEKFWKNSFALFSWNWSFFSFFCYHSLQKAILGSSFSVMLEKYINYDYTSYAYSINFIGFQNIK